MPSKGKKQAEPQGRIVTFVQGFNKAHWTAPPNSQENDFDAFLRYYKLVPMVHSAVDIQVDHCMASEYTLEPAAEEWAEAVDLPKILRETFYGLILYGNWLIEFAHENAPYTDRDGGFPGLLGVPPQTMNAQGIGNRITGWIHSMDWSDTKVYQPDVDIVHIHTDILDGSKWGPGVIRAAFNNLEMKMAMENLEFNVFKQFAQPIHTFMPPKDAKNPPTDAQMKQLLKDFDDLTEEEIRAMAINKNIEADIIGSGRTMPDFMPFITFNETQVYIAMGVPPVLLERGQNATEATAKIQLAAFNRRTEARHHIVEDFFNRKILPYAPGKPKLKFNPPVEPTFNVPATDEGDKRGGEQQQPGNRSQPIPAR
jgi:hypothetical protein